jgi:hypothetical protein
MYLCMYVCMYVCKRVCMYVYVYVYVCMYVCMYVLISCQKLGYAHSTHHGESLAMTVVCSLKLVTDTMNSYYLYK